MTKTVGEIAAENPSSVRVFRRYGIDYCCGGKVSLDEACRSRGIGPAELRAELEQAAAAHAGQERPGTLFRHSSPLAADRPYPRHAPCVSEVRIAAPGAPFAQS